MTKSGQENFKGRWAR